MDAPEIRPPRDQKMVANASQLSLVCVGVCVCVHDDEGRLSDGPLRMKAMCHHHIRSKYHVQWLSSQHTILGSRPSFVRSMTAVSCVHKVT